MYILFVIQILYNHGEVNTVVYASCIFETFTCSDVGTACNSSEVRDYLQEEGLCSQEHNHVVKGQFPIRMELWGRFCCNCVNLRGHMEIYSCLEF